MGATTGRAEIGGRGSVVAEVSFVVGEHVSTGGEGWRLLFFLHAHTLAATPFEHNAEIRNTATSFSTRDTRTTATARASTPTLTTFAFLSSSRVVLSLESFNSYTASFPSFLPSSSCASSFSSLPPPSFNCHPVSEIEQLSSSCLVLLSGRPARLTAALLGRWQLSGRRGVGVRSLARDNGGGAARPILHSHICSLFSESEILLPPPLPLFPSPARCSCRGSPPNPRNPRSSPVGGC